MFSRSTVSLFAALALSSGVVVLAADQNQIQSDTTSAKAQYPGRVVETELEHKRGRYLYEIDVIGDDGMKKELKFDAKTGVLISSKVEDADEED